MPAQVVGEVVVPPELLHLYTLLISSEEGDLQVLTVNP